MDKQSRISFILLITGTFIFDFLFWKESMGINVLLFDIFIMICAYSIGFKPWRTKMSIILSISLLASSAAICLHSSIYTITMHYISLVLFIGLVQQDGIDSLIFIICSSITSLFRFHVVLFKKIPKKKATNIRRTIKFLKLILIPAIILWIFYWIYKYANPVFDTLSFRFFDKLINLLSPFFKNISFLHICFILLGFSICAWILSKTDTGQILINQAKMAFDLIRKKKKLTANEKQTLKNLQEKAPVYYREKFKLSMKLKYELVSAAFLLILINALLLIVNIIDISWVWFGFKYSANFDLKQFVHEGTYLLIISILLSISIMLYFFRRNLNFYKKAKKIKILTYVWIIQNLILAISVAIRNFRYIEYWGLAYKRIGVILFLIAVVYGLISLYFKIKYTKTAYYLIKKNILAVYLILIVSSLLNWDYIIAKHNLNHPLKNNMETSYLLCLSDKVMPLIDKQEYVLDQDLKFNTYENFYPYSYRQYYQLRVKQFIKDYEKRSWTSWNYAEWKAYNYYTEKYKNSLENYRK